MLRLTRRNFLLGATATTGLCVLTGCGGGGDGASSSSYDNSDSDAVTQAIVNWQIVSDGPEPGYKIVQFFTTLDIPAPLMLAMPDRVLSGQEPVASLFLDGDLDESRAEYDDEVLAGFLSSARLVEREEDPIAVYRPHGYYRHWRNVYPNDEIPTQRVLFRYLSDEFGIELFNLYGHSGGSLVAASIYQHPPLQHLVATVGLSAPPLYGKYKHHPGQYDPFDHLEELVGLDPPIPVLFVYDRRDGIIDPAKGSLPYEEKAKRLRIPMILGVEVEADGPPYHYTYNQLGDELRAPGHEAYRPYRSL